RELPGIKQVESPCRKTGAFCYGKLGGFTKTCRSHDGYSAWEGLVFLGSEAHFLPDITQWFSVNGCLFRTTDYYF
ncbi:hypothetical protein, partial [Pectobacterium versatile]